MCEAKYRNLLKNVQKNVCPMYVRLKTVYVHPHIYEKNNRTSNFICYLF